MMTSGVRSRSRAVRASTVPLSVGIAAVGISLLLGVIVIAAFSAPIRFGPVSLPLVTRAFWGLSLVGYVLTPIVVVGCYGWDAIGQRDGLRRDPNFADRPGFGRVLRWLALASILIGAWHILNLSVPLSEMTGFAS